MKKVCFALALIAVMSVGWNGPSLAEKISVDEVLLAVLVDDFKVDDYTAQVTLANGTSSERSGTTVYKKTNIFRTTIEEDELGNPLDGVMIFDGSSLTVYDDQAHTVQHVEQGNDPLSMDFRSLYFLSAQSPILHWTFSDGSTLKDVAPSNQYELRLQGADLGITIKVDTARRAVVERRVDLGGGKYFLEVHSDFATVGGVSLPGRRNLSDNLGNTREDLYSSYVVNTQPAPSLFRVP
jgi:outer membrane lipoprotein-sorting protein